MIRVIAALLFGSITAVQAAAPVVFPGPDASWTVRIQYRVPVKDKPTYSSCAIQRFGSLRRDLITWSDGKSSEIWWVDKPSLVLVKDRGSEEIRMSEPDEAIARMKLDESMFRWISPAGAKGEETIEGVKCVLYEGTASDGPYLGGFQCRAWIDRENLRPVALEFDNVLYTFTFLAPPGSLRMSRPFEEKLERFIKITSSPAPLTKRGGRN